jgi:hypothetical protein
VAVLEWRLKFGQIRGQDDNLDHEDSIESADDSTKDVSEDS